MHCLLRDALAARCVVGVCVVGVCARCVVGVLRGCCGGGCVSGRWDCAVISKILTASMGSKNMVSSPSVSGSTPPSASSDTDDCVDVPGIWSGPSDTDGWSGCAGDRPNCADDVVLKQTEKKSTSPFMKTVRGREGRVEESR